MDKIVPNEKIKRLEKLADLTKGIEAKIKLMPDFNDLKFDPVLL